MNTTDDYPDNFILIEGRLLKSVIQLNKNGPIGVGRRPPIELKFTMNIDL